MDRVGSMLDRDGGKDRVRTLETGCGDGVREQIFFVVFLINTCLNMCRKRSHN